MPLRDKEYAATILHSKRIHLSQNLWGDISSEHANAPNGHWKMHHLMAHFHLASNNVKYCNSGKDICTINEQLQKLSRTKIKLIQLFRKRRVRL